MLLHSVLLLVPLVFAALPANPSHITDELVTGELKPRTVKEDEPPKGSRYEENVYIAQGYDCDGNPQTMIFLPSGNLITVHGHY